VVTNPGDQTDDEGLLVVLNIVVIDPNPGDTHTWTATGLPPGLFINSLTGAITGTLQTGSVVPYSVSVTATDDGTPTMADTVTFTWTVNPP
jgi:hypothetical protein